LTSAFDPRRFLSNSSVHKALQSRLRRDNTSQLLADEVLRILPGQRVLDIGCVPADILSFLPDSIECYGFDVEPNCIEAATARYGERGTFVVGAVAPETMNSLGPFDVISSLAVLHHLNDAEVETMFSAAASLLNPEGRFVTLDCAYVKGQHPVALLLASMDRGEYVRTPEAYADLARRHF